jgi:hypothetical protein
VWVWVCMSLCCTESACLCAVQRVLSSMRACLCVVQRVCLDVYMCLSFMSMRVCHVYVCVCLYVYVCVCLNVYMCVCLYVYVLYREFVFMLEGQGFGKTNRKDGLHHRIHARAAIRNKLCRRCPSFLNFKQKKQTRKQELQSVTSYAGGAPLFCYLHKRNKLANVRWPVPTWK